MSDIRVAVLDDQPLSRAGTVHALSAETDITVVGEGSLSANALHLAAKAAPHVMLLAVNMEGDSFMVMQDVLAGYPTVKLIILSGDPDADQVRWAMRLGVRRFLLDTTTGAELADAIRRVQRGERCVAPAPPVRLPTLALAVSATPTEVHPGRLAELTRREKEVLAHVALGLNNREIGSQLKLSEKTVKRHVSLVLDKLGVRSRLQAAMLLHQQ